MGNREWTALRIIDVLIAAAVALPLTVVFWLLSIMQVGYLNDHVVNCQPPNTPQPGDPWACGPGRLRAFQWFGWTAFVVWLAIVWGGMAWSIRRGWWLAVWPLAGLALFWGIEVLEVRATKWHAAR